MPMQIAPQGMLALKARAAQGDPQAQQMLQELGSGSPSMTSPSPMPNPGVPPQGAMTQSQFGNSQPIPPDVAARRAQQLIKLLRERE